VRLRADSPVLNDFVAKRASKCLSSPTESVNLSDELNLISHDRLFGVIENALSRDGSIANNKRSCIADTLLEVAGKTVKGIAGEMIFKLYMVIFPP
jgi:hypothetical protein